MKTIRNFQVARAGEFGIYTQSDELPVSDCPVYLMEGVGGICLSGTATVQVFSHRFRIVRGMVLALFPWQLISIKEVSDDSGSGFPHIARYVYRYPQFPVEGQARFLFYMRTHIASEPREEYVGRFLNFCDLLAYRAENAPVICRRESVMQLCGCSIGTSTPSISMIRRLKRLLIPIRKNWHSGSCGRSSRNILPTGTWRISPRGSGSLRST